MSRDILIGVDAGTSVIKAVAFSLAGEQIAVAARPNVYETPGPGQVEQDGGGRKNFVRCGRSDRLAGRLACLARLSRRHMHGAW
jgi:glycerol kinase